MNPKRPANDAHGKPGSDPKRAKVQEFAPPLVTKPFSSAPGLKKPFKSPFLQAPLEKSSTVNRPQHTAKSAPVLDRPPVEAFATEVKKARSSSPVEDNLATADSDPAQLPLTQVDLEDKVSTKVPVDLRRKSLDAIRRALHTSFSHHPSLWGWFRSSKPHDDSKAADFFASVARDLEYLALTFCSTAEGYEERVKTKCYATNHLAEMIDAGKDPTKDEDVSEIVQSVKVVLQGRVFRLLLSS
ncbi:hypothetical protein AAF712_015302 [Marasmius tenuissimus]|uniref:Uncharacterized protein n=1 Tax=Marasmius tenuissimus TaxID=585030 RepID=A0ABR2Z8M6_9AGAR